MLFNVGGLEIVTILVLALIVLGPDKLPNAARQAGKFISEFRRMSDGFQRELRDAMDISDLTTPTSTKTANTMATITPVDTDTAGDAHRVIESANGPTLPPLDVTTAEVATAEVATAEVATTNTTGEPAATESAPSPAVTDEGPGPVTPVQVDGPTTSFN